MRDETQTAGPMPDGVPNPSVPGSPVPPAPLPRALKHYKVIREIGAGGMGRVLKCLDTTLNRYVALKVLRTELARDPNFLERFRREAMAVAKTRHPNIVQIHSIDSDGDTAFYVMEYIEGEGLDRLVERRGRIPEREAVDIIRQAADGLAHVHQAGILHRDVKPSNLLLDSGGRVVLTDFGLAKMEFHGISRTASSLPASRRPPGETDPDRVIGTPYYISPECLSGREPDARSDLYALGIVSYEMLTGKVPFGGDSPSAIFRGHLYDIPVPIGELAPETSLRVANIVYRCIEKNPSARYQECRDLISDLNAVKADWGRDRESEDRRRQAVEIALAMRIDRPSPRNHNIGRMASTAAVLATIVILLLIAMKTFQAIPPAVSLPRGTSAGDAVWNPGSSARVFGALKLLGFDGDRVSLDLSRHPDEAPVKAFVPRVKWEKWGGGNPPRAEEWLFLEGRVAGSAGLVWLEVPEEGLIWKPRPPELTLLDALVPVDPADVGALAPETRVRAAGDIMSRSEIESGNCVFELGNGATAPVEFVIAGTYVQEPDLRIGDHVVVEGRISKSSDRRGARIQGTTLLSFSRHARTASPR